MESFEDRLRRFLLGSPNEVFFTILNSISNSTLRQLRSATDAELYDLAVLGAHGVMQTVVEQIYGRTGLPATVFYLENFVDGHVDDRRFSLIARELHHFRNVHAHRWSSRSSHTMGFDTGIPGGWLRDENGLHLNPRVFQECFAAGFGTGTRMWTMPRDLTELEAVRRKYRFLRQWLELDNADEIARQIQTLEVCADIATAREREGVVRPLVTARFGL